MITGTMRPVQVFDIITSTGQTTTLRVPLIHDTPEGRRTAAVIAATCYPRARSVTDRGTFEQWDGDRGLRPLRR